ncbi:MAG: hypothetical protein ACKESB_03565 [Candidatus Hodgkinia cicadicola]
MAVLTADWVESLMLGMCFKLRWYASTPSSSEHRWLLIWFIRPEDASLTKRSQSKQSVHDICNEDASVARTRWRQLGAAALSFATSVSLACSKDKLSGF